MSILFYVLAFLACIAAAAAGAWCMRWYIQRSRVVADREDPRDTQIRDLLAQVSMAKNSMERHDKRAGDAAEHVDLAHQRIVELQAQLAKLARLANAMETELKEEKSDKALLRDKLAVANQQLDTMKQRTQELEVELSVSHDSGNMLDPHAQVSGVERPDTGGSDELDAMTAPEVDATAPSLIQSLTTELDRWKRHCQVLGDELKLQRERLAQIGETTDTDENPFDSIDELTDIRGIGNAIARKLHQLGIYRYRELAGLSDDDLERAHMLIPDFERRMRRDHWQDQARNLHHEKYAEPL